MGYTVAKGDFCHFNFVLQEHTFTMDVMSLTVSWEI